MSTTYRVEYTATVLLKIRREDILTRVHEEGWKSQFYSFLTDEDAVDMLAMHCGIEERSLDSVDGWADCQPEDITCVVRFDREEVAEVKEGDQ